MHVLMGLAFASPWQLEDAYRVAPEGEVAPLASATVRTREFDMEVNFRGRFVSVPNAILDIWYFDSDSNEDDSTYEWPLPGQDRPRVRGYAGGVEFVVKGESANGIFYFEYLKSSMEAGYWDDVESPVENRDGEFLVPTDNLGFFTVGANYAYEAHLIASERTRGRFGWSLLVGGGLGVAIRTGRVDRWVADGTLEDSDLSNPSYKLYSEGAPPFSQKANVPPPVLPMIDLNAGMRFTFGERVVIRVEGGLHTMLYYGATAGLMF